MNIRMKKSRFAGIVVCGASLALIFSGCGRNAQKAEEDPEGKMKPVLVEVSPVELRRIDTVVLAQGTLSAAQGGGVRIAAVSPGRITSVRVKEGDRVSVGQVVATIDTRIQQAQAQSASSAYRVSKLQSEQANLEVLATKEDHTNSLQVARLELEIAQTELKKLRAGARPQEVAQAEEAVVQAQANRDRSKTELERVQFLHEKGIAAKRQLDDAKTAYSVAESAVKSAKQQADLVKAGTRAEDLKSAELHVKTAQANLRKEERSTLQVAAKEREARAVAETIQQKQADMTAAQATANTGELRSTISGVVSRRFLNPGDMADTSTPILEITQPRVLDLLANVPSEDGMKIRAGMITRVSVSGLLGSFQGRVISIGQVDPQSGLMAVRISVENPAGVLKVGLFASAEVVTRSNPRAVAVPKEAVINRDGKQMVYVFGKDNLAHQKSVVLGSEQSKFIEVIQGVAPGEAVIRMGQFELTDGAKVRTASSKGD